MARKTLGLAVEASVAEMVEETVVAVREAEAREVVARAAAEMVVAMAAVATAAEEMVRTRASTL